MWMAVGVLFWESILPAVFKFEISFLTTTFDSHCFVIFIEHIKLTGSPSSQTDIKAKLYEFCDL